MNETADAYRLAVARLKTALQGCVETARDLEDGTDLPKMLRDGLSAVAIANGSIEALVERPASWEAGLVRALAFDAQFELDDAERHRAGRLGHLMQTKRTDPAFTQCHCGWEGRGYQAEMAHLRTVLLEADITRAAELGHEMVVRDGSLRCVCDWLPDHGGLVVAHLVEVASAERPLDVGMER